MYIYATELIMVGEEQLLDIYTARGKAERGDQRSNRVDPFQRKQIVVELTQPRAGQRRVHASIRHIRRRSVDQMPKKSSESETMMMAVANELLKHKKAAHP